MNKKTVGLLVGIGAGLGIAWALRDKFAGVLGGKNLDIVLKTVVPGQQAGVSTQPAVVTVFKDTHITWHVTNDSDKDVLVALANWNDGDNHGRRPAVDADVDPDDHEDPPQHDLTRLVPAGKKRKIRGKSRKADAIIESVYYDVNLDGTKGVDPIVRLVL